MSKKKEDLIQELEEKLAEARRLQRLGIDPVTLKNLPQYAHELPAVVPVTMPTNKLRAKVNVTGLVNKWGRK
jgi:hypothetical protein